jgi:hypothetical protein
MAQESTPASVYRARPGREVFDVPLEWRVEDTNGALTCVVYDEVTASRIVAALNLAERVVAAVDGATLTEAIVQFKLARG